jgi:hypothetical protein
MPTVTALKALFQAQIAPGNDEEFLRILTEADMRLLEWGSRFRWAITTDTLSLINGYVLLDADYASILGARVAKTAVSIQSYEYEFVPGGPGEVELGVGSSRLIDQGIDDAGFRYYKVAGHLDDDDIVTALLHYAPVTLYDPDIVDSSVPDDAVTVTRCPDATALKLMMLGILMEEAHDHGGARSYISDALKSLDNKEQSQRGNAVRTINSRPNGYGVRGIRGFR